MATETKVSNFKINLLKPEQYDSIEEPDDNQLYFVATPNGEYIDGEDIIEGTIPLNKLKDSPASVKIVRWTRDE